MKNILIIAVTVVSLTACTSSTNEKKNFEHSSNSTKQIRYERTGGGNIDFIIQENGDEVLVNITRKEFRDVDINLMFAKTEIPEEDRNILDSLFTGIIDINQSTSPNKLPTGTWVHVFILSGSEWVKVYNDSAVKELGSFESLVRDKCR